MTTCNYCDLPRENSDYVCQCADLNQCDGCRRNLLLDHKGMHREMNGWPVMLCTADRYKKGDLSRRVPHRRTHGI